MLAQCSFASCVRDGHRNEKYRINLGVCARAPVCVCVCAVFCNTYYIAAVVVIIIILARRLSRCAFHFFFVSFSFFLGREMFPSTFRFLLHGRVCACVWVYVWANDRSFMYCKGNTDSRIHSPILWFSVRARAHTYSTHVRDRITCSLYTDSVIQLASQRQ